MLYLTYNIDIEKDGLGAQYQRIIGIICVAEYYNFTYVHTPIKKMEHINDLTYLDKVENFFQICNNYSNINNIEYDEIYEESNPFIENLAQYIKKDKNVLIKIFLPYNICEQNINIYKLGINKIRNFIINHNLPFYNNNNKKIAIHLRRGDVTKHANNFRYTSITDIVNIINYLKKKYKNYFFYIFTQIDENNKNEFEIFKNDSSIYIYADKDLILTINHLINADILVLSKSSLSYISGLYNNNIVYYHNFWHKPLDNWNIIEDLKNDSIFDSENDIDSENVIDSENYTIFNFNHIIILSLFVILYFIK